MSRPRSDLIIDFEPLTRGIANLHDCSTFVRIIGSNVFGDLYWSHTGEHCMRVGGLRDGGTVYIGTGALSYEEDRDTVLTMIQLSYDIPNGDVEVVGELLGRFAAFVVEQDIIRGEMCDREKMHRSWLDKLRMLPEEASKALTDAVAWQA